MSMAIAAGAAVAVGSAAISANAAKKGAKAQADATDRANAAAAEQARQVREDLTPYRNLGSGASNKLSYLLGVDDPAATAKAKAIYAEPDDVTKAYREFLGRNPEAGGKAYYDRMLAEHGLDWVRNDIANSAEARAPHGQYVPSAEEQAAIAQAQAVTDAPKGEDYGSLLRAFTGQDLENDPGYQFGLNEGRKALEGSAAARGGLFSGAAGKALTRYGNDYAGTKFNEAFNRDAANKSRIYSMLSGGASLGENAAAQTGNAGMSAAQQYGANTTANANAQGASGIAQGNAWGNALNQGWNQYQSNELMKKLQAPSSYSSGGGGYTLDNSNGAWWN